MRYDYGNRIGARPVRKIQLRDAKVNLSQVVDQAVRGKPCVITRHGKPEAVVPSFKEWERLSHVPSFGRLPTSAPTGLDELRTRDRSPMRHPRTPC
jgi:prevent-host-death family protein